VAKTGKTIAVVLPPKSIDQYGVIVAGIQTYAAAFRRRGFATAFLDCNAPAYQSEAARLLADPQVVAFFSSGGWAVDCHVTVGARKVNAFEHVGKAFIATYADFPYCPWIHWKLEYEFPSKVSLYNDQASVEFVERAIEPRGAHGFFVPAYFDVQGDSKRLEQRPSKRKIPLLYVGKQLDPAQLRRDFLTLHPGLASPFDALVESALYSCRTPLWRHAEEILAAFGRPFDLRDKAVIELLYVAGLWIYSRRRALMLARLKRFPAIMVVSGPVDRTGLHPDARVLRARSFAEVLALYEQARAVLICQPLHSHGITERTMSVIHRRAALVTTGNNWLDSTFVPGRHLLTLNDDFSDLEERIAELDDDEVVDSMSAEAWHRIAEEYSPDAVVGRYLDAIKQTGAGA
jgi:hypothetical protein